MDTASTVQTGTWQLRPLGGIARSRDAGGHRPHLKLHSWFAVRRSMQHVDLQALADCAAGSSQQQNVLALFQCRAFRWMRTVQLDP